MSNIFTFNNCTIEKWSEGLYNYKAIVNHIKFKHKDIMLSTDSEEKLNTLIFNKTNILNDIWQYNKNTELKRKQILNRKKEVNIDWNIIENEGMLLYKPFSTSYIQYNSDSGKPEAYFPINNLSKSTRKKPVEPSKILNLFFDKDKREKNYKIDVERYMKLDEEQQKWKKDYPTYIKKLESEYKEGKKEAVELYSKLILKHLKFNIHFDKKYDITYHAEEPSLVVNYSIININEIFLLVQDRVYSNEKKNEYEDKHVDAEEYINRLDFVWGQIILQIIYDLFQSDVNQLIKRIYLNGKIYVNNKIYEFGTSKYSTELIVTRQQFKDAFFTNEILYVLNLINDFRRDYFFIRELQYKGIHLEKAYSEDTDSFYLSNDKGIVTSIRIDGDKDISSEVLNIISEFRDLKELKISNNPSFKKIPKEIFTLLNIERLTFYNTNISIIPSEIKELINLKEIKFSYNKIVRINPTIRMLPNLKRLDLTGNKIDKISLDVLEMLLDMILTEFTLDKNPILEVDCNLYNDALISELIGNIKNPKIEEKSNSNLSDIKSDDNRPLILTEGKTDWKHLKKALERFKSEEFNFLYLDLDIKFKEYEDVSMSDSELDDYAQSYAKEKNPRKIICVFDRDLPVRVETYGKHDFMQVGNKQYINTLKDKCGKKYGKRSPKYLELEQQLDDSQFEEIDVEIRKILTGDEQEEWKTLLHNNVYAFCIPKLNDELDEICIEFYYKDNDLKKEDEEGKRLFIADEFEFQENGKNCNRFISNCGKYKTDTQSGNSNNKKITLQYPNKKERGYVYKIDEKECNKSNTMNLSKNKFAENIYYDVEGFDDFDIENFRLIFDVIEKIVKD